MATAITEALTTAIRAITTPLRTTDITDLQSTLVRAITLGTTVTGTVAITGPTTIMVVRIRTIKARC